MSCSPCCNDQEDVWLTPQADWFSGTEEPPRPNDF